MWAAKFKIQHDDWILDKTLKYNLTASGIPLSAYKKDGIEYHTGMVYLNGTNKNIQRFINSLKKEKRIIKFHVKGNQIFILNKGQDNISILLSKQQLAMVLNLIGSSMIIVQLSMVILGFVGMNTIPVILFCFLVGRLTMRAGSRCQKILLESMVRSPFRISLKA